MTFWWLIPVSVTGLALIWVLYPREDEKSNGSMFDGMSRALGLAIRGGASGTVSTAAWLIWSLLT